ncbi:MAG: hypothetical protein ACFFCC_02460 [Promethearchaeota archaeon]
MPRRRKRLDENSQRDIYKRATNKFRKNLKGGFPHLKINFLRSKQIQSFPTCLNLTEKYDLVLINSNRLMSLLKLAKLSKSVRKFGLLSFIYFRNFKL